MRGLYHGTYGSRAFREYGFTAFMAAFSIKATSAGVANTSISPEPSAKAVLVEFTCTVLLYVSPVSIVFLFEVINSFFSLG